MLQHYVQHCRGYKVMSTRKSDWLKAFCCVTALRAMLQEADTQSNSLLLLPFCVHYCTQQNAIAKVGMVQFSDCAKCCSQCCFMCPVLQNGLGLFVCLVLVFHLPISHFGCWLVCGLITRSLLPLITCKVQWAVEEQDVNKLCVLGSMNCLLERSYNSQTHTPAAVDPHQISLSVLTWVAPFRQRSRITSCTSCQYAHIMSTSLAWIWT